jgi:hypothetical protein
VFEIRLRFKKIFFVYQEDSQWLTEGDLASNGYGSWEQRLGSTECINRTVFVGALHGMMTAYALARICQELFGDVEYAAIDTDRNKYPIGKYISSTDESEYVWFSLLRFWTCCICEYT